MIADSFPVSTPPILYFPHLESAVIYAANNGSYFNTQSEISNGTGVSNGVGNECILPFEAGKKYRIRLINMSALASEFCSFR